MIKSKGGEVTVKGKKEKVLADLTCAVVAVREHLKELGCSEDSANEMMSTAIVIGFAVRDLEDFNGKD